MSLERGRLPLALLLSLLIHTLLLSLTFGGRGLGLPGFAFPWQVRRIEVPDLRVVLVPAQATAEEPAVTPVAAPLQQAWVEQPVAGRPALTPPVAPAPTPGRTTAAIVPMAKSSEEANPRADAATDAAPAKTPLRADRPNDTAPPPIPAPAVIALAGSDESTWVVPATPATPTPVIAAASSASSLQTAMPPPRDALDAAQAQFDQKASERDVELAGLDRAKQEAQRQTEQMEAARAETARLEAERLEVERQAAAQQEAALQEAARQAADLHESARQGAARQEAARVEAARVEAARVEAARVEAARVEAARVEAARVEAARVEAARVEVARVEAARVEAARVEAARVEAARAEAAQEAIARREAVLRAIGRQLDEEAARRDAATASARSSTSLAPSSSGARRYWLFGRSDPNEELILYAEAWSRKIQLNMTFDMVREAAKQPHTDPVVTVAIRSDGSVESVTFVQSSGVTAIDEAIRRIVDSQKPFQAFPPGLASEYDVIHIRRTWYFDMAIRLY